MHEPNERLGTNSTTAQRLVSILARIWATELGEESDARLLNTLTVRHDASQSLVTPPTGVACSSATRPGFSWPQDQANKWLHTFLNGPNKLMHICSPSESQQLLNSLYNQQQEVSRKFECLMTWQLAIGARYTADVDERTYTAIYESARTQTKICIEEDDDMLLWVVPTLLLRCLYLMDSQPRNCWFMLGESSTLYWIQS